MNIKNQKTENSHNKDEKVAIQYKTIIVLHDNITKTKIAMCLIKSFSSFGNVHNLSVF